MTQASIYFTDESRLTLWLGRAHDAAAQLATGSVQTICTSPPYFGLRDYGNADQIGGEATLGEYIEHLRSLFAELRRVLADDGTLWLNLGDSYAANYSSLRPKGGSGIRADADSPRTRVVRTEGFAPKNLLMVPARAAIALQEDGWILRRDIIWDKPNAMPEPVKDRPTAAHEYVFLFSKSPRYYYDADAIAEDAVSSHGSGNGFARPERVSLGGRGQDAPWTNVGGKRNSRDVWTIPTVGFPGAHFAVFPPEIPRRAILAGSKPGDLVLDPFSGSGTTGMVALREGRRYVGFDVSQEYLDISLAERFSGQPLDMGAAG